MKRAAALHSISELCRSIYNQDTYIETKYYLAKKKELSVMRFTAMQVAGYTFK